MRAITDAGSALHVAASGSEDGAVPHDLVRESANLIPGFLSQIAANI